MTAQAPAGITQRIKLPPELQRIPVARREQKIGESFLGIAIALIGVGLLAFAVYLAVQSVPALIAGQIALKSAAMIVMAGAAAAGIALMVWGALIADRETALPVLKAMVDMGVGVLRARKDS